MAVSRMHNENYAIVYTMINKWPKFQRPVALTTYFSF